MTQKAFKIEDSFGFALHHASYIFKATMKERFREAGINATLEEFVFLFLIPEHGAAQNDLTRKSLKGKTTVTRLIDRLVNKGWVSREENVKNRREQRISVTPKGWKIKATIMPIVQKQVTAATAGLTAEQIESARQALNQVILNLID